MEKKEEGQHMDIWTYGEKGGRSTYGHREKKVAGQHMGIWIRRWQGNIWAYEEEGGRATCGHMKKACKQISIFMDLTDSFYHVNALRKYFFFCYDTLGCS
ncbi:lysosomal alpha-mannosidase [Biomphalaria glabrata]|nr:lysosomal alpha-mannosidase [Biomphalaria glabrata]